MVSVNWATSVITVFKTDMTQTQSSPIEIYELNVDTFRLTLKGLEDDTDGISYLKTHDHNTEVVLSGVTYSRVIEILPPYTVTFEDDQYVVVLKGGNNNIADRKNANQVSLTTNNSAGLIDNVATLSSADKDDIVDRIYDEDLTTHTTADSFGEWLNTKGLTVLKFLGLK